MKKITKFDLKKLVLKLNFTKDKIKIDYIEKGKEGYKITYSFRSTDNLFYTRTINIKYTKNKEKDPSDFISVGINVKEKNSGNLERDVERISAIYVTLLAINKGEVLEEVDITIPIVVFNQLVCVVGDVPKYLDYFTMSFVKGHELIDAYKDVENDFMEFLEGKAKNTKLAYKYAMMQFLSYLFFRENQRFSGFDEKVINEFFEYLLTEENRATTYINQIYHAIASYCEYKEKFISSKKIRIPAVPSILEQTPKSLGKEDLDTLLENLNNIKSSVELDVENEHSRIKYHVVNNRLSRLRDTWRNPLIVKLQLTCGLRISEALNLRISDIDLENKLIFIRQTKNQTPRSVPITNSLANELGKYIEFRKNMDFRVYVQRAITNNHDVLDLVDLNFNINDEHHIKKLEQLLKRDFIFVDYLFVSNRYKKISQNAMMKTLQKYKITSHQFRHTMIKNLVDNNIPTPHVARLSGHKSMNMISRYSVPTDKELQKIIENTTISPK